MKNEDSLLQRQNWGTSFLLLIDVKITLYKKITVTIDWLIITCAKVKWMNAKLQGWKWRIGNNVKVTYPICEIIYYYLKIYKQQINFKNSESQGQWLRKWAFKSQEKFKILWAKYNRKYNIKIRGTQLMQCFGGKFYSIKYI